LLALGALRVAVQEGVDVDPLAAGRVDPKGGVADPRQRCVCHALSFVAVGCERNAAGTSGASAKVHRVGRRLLLAALVASAPVADAAGQHTAAFWALVVAVPFAAACGLASFGACLDDREDTARALQALL